MKRKKVIAGQHFNDAKHNIGQLTVHITTQATVIVQPIVFVRVGDVLSREAQTRNPLRGLNFTHKKRVVVQSAVHARQFLKNWYAAKSVMAEQKHHEDLITALNLYVAKWKYILHEDLSILAFHQLHLEWPTRWKKKGKVQVPVRWNRAVVEGLPP